MTTPERLRDLADAIAAHARSGEPLKAEDQAAIAAALHAEADRFTNLRRIPAIAAWATRRAA